MTGLPAQTKADLTWPRDQNAGGALDGGHVLRQGRVGYLHYSSREGCMQDAQCPTLVAIGKGGVRHVESGNVGREAEHVPRLDALRDSRYALEGHHPAGHFADSTLGLANVPEHIFPDQSRVPVPVLAHEIKLPRILASAELCSHILQ